MPTLLAQLTQLATTRNIPDPKLVQKHNIKLGLRNADGSGVVVGLTSKGSVIGYEKVSKSNPQFNREDITLQVPGLKNQLSPAETCFYLIKGRLPEAGELKAFLSRLTNISTEYEVKPTDGRLYYCGYAIEDLINAYKETDEEGFDETTFLLLTGELPTKPQLKSFHENLIRRRNIPMRVNRLITYDSDNPNQMGALHRAVSALSLADKDPNSSDMSHQVDQCLNLIAKFPTIIAHNYNSLLFRKGKGHGLINPSATLSPMENFIYMLNGSRPDKFTAKLLDIMMVLHAEHGGGNNSTFTVRSVTSSGANSYMAICSGIASLSGHLHGGANEAVLDMMNDIQKNVKDWKDKDEIKAYLRKILAGEAHDGKGKIYGLGHAVYTLSDPRAVILTEKAEELAEMAGQQDIYGLYKDVAQMGCELLKKEKGKVVSPNVDFYSGFVYQTIGVSKELFTPLFAMSRITGWCAHRLEQIAQGRIIRPAYISSISPRAYVDIIMRK